MLHNLGSRVLSQEDDNTPLTNDLKTRYSDPKVKDILNIATFLDPRFKADYVNGVDLEMLEDMILNQGIEFIDHEQHESQEHQQQAQEPELPLPKKKKLLTFQKHLCICATSCTSECLFSTSGNIVSPHRASLKPHKVNMLVFFIKKSVGLCGTSTSCVCLQLCIVASMVVNL